MTCAAAAIPNNLSSGSIKAHCIKGHNNDIIDSRWMGRELFMKKTWREIGYDYRKLTDSEIERCTAELALLKEELQSTQ